MRQEKSRVENPVVKKALNLLGIPSIPLKLVAGSDTGRPDELFLIPFGRPLFIEFKWDAWEPEPKQLYWHRILEDLGYDVQVHNDVDAALAAIAVKVVAAAIYAEGGKVPSRTRCRDPYVGSRTKENLHYARSFQFLKEAGCSEAVIGDRAFESLSSGLAR
jgi:hypothetical protein